MILLDTDVAVDILRNHPPAVSWLQGLGAAPLGIPGLAKVHKTDLGRVSVAPQGRSR